MAEAWDCDLFTDVTIEPYDIDIDYEDDEGDYQILALDRFADRSITDSLKGRGEAAFERCW